MPASTVMTTRQLVLIRHAQSLENVALQQAVDGFSRLRRFQLMSGEQTMAVNDLLWRHDNDADVSPLGQLQMLIHFLIIYV
jgi:hypothetical protein